MDDLITAADAAKLLHLHVKRVQQMAREGTLPAVRFGRKWLFHRQQLAKGIGGQRAKLRPTTSGALDISARNQLSGRITAVIADGVMAEVHIRIGDHDLVSLISRSSAERLSLSVGDDVYAVIKSTEVMVAKSAE